jgi:nucleoside 2-deoxyribosyltransferase
MRIYLAGPDIFLPDAEAVAAAKKAICARHGATGIFPTDPIDDAAARAEADPAHSIYLHNEAQIRSADALIANLTPFRGPSADPGTVYELGLMRGLGRPVFGYSNTDLHFAARTLAFLGDRAGTGPGGLPVDEEGLAIEEFGLQDNLMIPGGIRAAGGILVVREVPPARRWHDLTGFEACVQAAMRAAHSG